MNNKFLLGAIALGAMTIGSAVVTPEAQAFSLAASSLETNGNPDADASWYDISLATNGDGTATFSLSNLVAAGNGTKISTVYFGDDNYFASIFKTDYVSFAGSTTPGTNYSFDWTASGGSQISNNNGGAWQVLAEADPATGSNASVINAGEVLKVTFKLQNAATTDADLLAAFSSTPQKLGMAFHVQSITGGYSEWYEATPPGEPPTEVPTPAAVLPVLGSLFGFARRKKGEATEA
jgi:hypothetical protein